MLMLNFLSASAMNSWIQTIGGICIVAFIIIWATFKK